MAKSRDLGGHGSWLVGSAAVALGEEVELFDDGAQFIFPVFEGVEKFGVGAAGEVLFDLFEGGCGGGEGVCDLVDAVDGGGAGGGGGQLGCHVGLLVVACCCLWARRVVGQRPRWFWRDGGGR